MTISVSCPRCGKAYKVKDELAGKAIKCRDCEATVPIPGTAADSLGDDAFNDVPSELPPSRSKLTPAARKSSASSANSTWKWVVGILGGFLALALVCCGGVAWIGFNAANQVKNAFEGMVKGVEVPPGKTFDEWRSEFHTKLTKTGPSEQEYDPDEQPPENVTVVTYPSGSLNLKAWVYRPPGVEEPRPALVFFHGGFAFGAGDLETCQPFMDAGFVVMAPMLRGENGNPGNYELFLGEIDDARAACQWLSQQPYVKADRIYTFGHSIGGGVSAVLSLLKDVPIRHGGSSGGLYDHMTFFGWSLDGTTPFENTPEERSVRLLLGNTAHMQHKHYAFIGLADEGFESSVAAAQQQAAVANGNLIIERVPGDHFESFDPALRKYLQIVQQDQ